MQKGPERFRSHEAMLAKTRVTVSLHSQGMFPAAAVVSVASGGLRPVMPGIPAKGSSSVAPPPRGLGPPKGNPKGVESEAGA